MNTQKLAEAFLQLSRALNTVHEALLESSTDTPLKQEHPPTTTPAAFAAPPPTIKTLVGTSGTPPAVGTGTPPAADTATQEPDPFLAFAGELKNILQMVPPGTLNTQLSQAIERYAPGAAQQGQGGIRKIPAEQYANFLAEIRQAAATLKGGAQ